LAAVVFGLAVSCNSSSPTAPPPQSQTPATPGAPPSLVGLTLAASSVAGGAVVQGTATLSAAAPAGGAVVTLSSSHDAARVPATLTIAAGATAVTFNVLTETVPFAVDATVTATTAGASRTARLRISPAAGDGPIQTVTSRTDDVIGGDGTEGSITLSQAAASGGVRLFIVSGDADVIVPATVTVAAGTTSATFDIRTRPVAALKDVQVTVSAAPVSARAVGRTPRTAA